MYKYIKYCTKEQTILAAELGAPIATCGYNYKQVCGCNTVSDYDLRVIPTQEEMLAWLREEKKVYISIRSTSTEPKWYTGWGNEFFDKYEDAASVAIIRALEYLKEEENENINKQ